jgi:drug/metabolite transporter (DMT)-like permease
MTVSARLNTTTIALLLIPPLMWAGNAVVGRMMQGSIPPFTFNFLRWVLAFAMLLPLAAWVLAPRSPVWTHWRRFAMLGLLSVALYNALQYMALKTSTPINVTLVASSMPVWMLLLGRLFYSVPVTRRAALGALMSLTGVVVVLVRGDWRQLGALQLVPGDAWMLAASITWAAYSWMLARPAPGSEPADVRRDWAAFLLAQVAFGLAWSSVMTAGEWALLPTAPENRQHLQWGWPLALSLLFVAVGPSLLAYRAWGASVARVGPTTAGFFSNLTPLFAALMSATLLGEPPHLYHLAGFVLIVGGILVSTKK